MKKSVQSKIVEQDDSSSSSSEKDMDTDMDEVSSEDESLETPSPFTLSLLQNKDKKANLGKLKSFLGNKSHSSSSNKKLLLSKSAESIPSDFTPWWNSFDHSITQKVTNSKTLAGPSHQSSNRLYDSWFDKSSASEETHSWLSGPKPKSVTVESTSQVEDIQVPSIYENVSKVPKSRRALKKERREQRNKTTGKKWYDMKLPELDSKTKMDMEMLQMRRALNPKKFFKQNDRKGLPKYFQLGTVVDEGTDFFSSRLTKKERKQTLVEELMADVNVRQYNKKKYEEIQQKQRHKKFSKKKKT